MQRNIGVVIVGCVLVIIGITSGWYAAIQGQIKEEEDAAPAAHGLTPQALANLGVEIGKAELSTFKRTVKVQTPELEIRTIETTLTMISGQLALVGGLVNEAADGLELLFLVDADILELRALEPEER